MNKDQIIKVLTEHGLSKSSIAVHSSLKSFGHIDGGASSVVYALVNVCRNVMMPTFCEIGRTNPPTEDRPLQNGWEYETYSINTKNIDLFDPNSFGVNSEVNVSEMGQISKSLLVAPGTVRSMHPSVSWCCNGPDSKWLLSGHSSDNPNLPLKNLVKIDGYVLLLGVDLTTCTAIHLAEEIAGRRPFIRWVKYVDGITRRVREYGCSNGFNNLRSDLSDSLNHFTIGQCNVVLAKLSDLVKICVEVIKLYPDRTICENSRSCRCQDAAKGGPFDMIPDMTPAQQVDAPEPATKAVSASQPSIPPAR